MTDESIRTKKMESNMNKTFAKCDFPSELKSVEQWVCWRYAERGNGKSAKMPINPTTGTPADVTDPDSWHHHYMALNHHEYGTIAEYRKYIESPTDGLGFVFTADDPYVGIDLDNCADMLGIEKWAWNIIEQIGSYAEYSPSRKGVHIITKGTLPNGNVRRGNVEMYECDRFFTVTGRQVPFTPSEVVSDNGAIENLYNAFIAIDSDDDRAEQQIITGGGQEPTEPTAGELPDEELLDKAKHARNGEKFTRLWNGDTSGYPSQSEADQALCNQLAFWTAHNRNQMDRLFRRSELMREKWDEQRGDRTYGELTIDAALRIVTNDYTPDYGY